MAIAACGGSSSSTPSGSTTPLAFHGSQSPFPGFKYDTGAEPAGSPVTLDLGVSVAGTLSADAAAISGGDSSNPTVAAVAGSGKYVLDVHFKLGGTLHAALTGVPTYDGAIPGIENVDIAFGGNVVFDPFLIGKDAPVTAKIPETKLPSIPLPGGIPGDLEITIEDGSTMTSTFHGVCAGVADNKATYSAQTTSSASVILQAAIVIHVPVLGDDTITIPSFTVNVPSVTQPLDMGTLDAKGGGAAPTGASLAAANGCTSVGGGGAGSDGGIGGGEGGISIIGSSDDGGSIFSDGGPVGEGGDGSVGACMPAAPSGVTYRPPSGAHQSLCTDSQISGYVTACGESGSKTTCSAFRTDPANSACAGCVATDIDASVWGPVIIAPEGTFLNFDGCDVLVNGSTSACDRADEMNTFCLFSACASCVGADETAVDTCAESAASGVCASYGSADDGCIFVETDAGMAICNDTMATADQALAAYVTLFCGQ